MKCIALNTYDERYTPDSWGYSNITRPFSVIYYVLGGSAFYTIDGIEKPFKKNHLYILPANKVFSLRELPYDKFYAMFIHAFTLPEVDSVIEIEVTPDSFIENTLDLLRKYVVGKEDIYVQKLTDMLLSYISEVDAEIEPSLPIKVKRYIDTNFISFFKSNDLSRQFNYSTSHLSKVFREKYDLTPKQYAQKLILKEIVILLQQGLPISEISDRLSFSSPENLSRFFKSHYGQPPSVYKKRFPDLIV